MVVTVVILAVLLVAALIGLAVSRRRLGASRAAVAAAQTAATGHAEQAAVAAAARTAAESARDEADLARTEAERRAAAAEKEAARATEQAVAADGHAATATAERERAQAETEAAARARVDAEERLAMFEQRAREAEAAQRAAGDDIERAERTAPAADGRLDAQVLWALEKARTERTWRYSVAVDPTASPFTDAGVALSDAIQVELDAAREEVGAEVDLDASLPDGLSAAGAVLTLRVVQELVADLVRRAETTTLRLRPDGDDLVVTVEAVDEDGQPVVPLALPIPATNALVPLTDGVRVRAVTG
ncbi:MAG: hypothetical protein ACK5OX_06865 [Desertimonas sp.]